MGVKTTKKNKKIDDKQEIEALTNHYKSYSKLELINSAINSNDLSTNEKKVIKTILDTKHSKYDNTKTKFSFNYYPDLTDPDFNYKIASKKEFNNFNDINKDKSYMELVKEKSDTSKPFVLSSAQKRITNYISPETSNNGSLLVQGTGSGKTCNGIAISEQFIPHILKNNQKVIILASKSLEAQFRKEIFDVEKYIINKKKNSNYVYSGCTGSTYPELLGVDNKNIQDVEQFAKDIKKIVDGRYGEIMGYDRFANKVKEIEANSLKNVYINDNNEEEKEKIKRKAIEKYFSNTVIIIDEVHNIKSSSEDAKKVPPMVEKVISCSKNSKLILMTATPMYDKSSEIIFLLNLLLLNDNRETINEADVFDKDDNLKPEGVNIIKNAARGYISYVRGENPYSFPFRLTPDINNDKNVYDLKKLPKLDIKGNKIPDNERLQYLKLICSTMFNVQNNTYAKFEGREYKNTNNIDIYSDDTKNFSSLRHLTTMCFPTEDYGDSGLRSCFNIKNSGSSYTYKPEILEKYGNFLHIDNIGNYSCKFKLIMEYIKKSVGPVFIYLEYIRGGIIPFALCLEQNGFQKYDHNNLLDIQRENVSYEGKLESEHKKGEPFHQAKYAMFSGDEILTGNKEHVIKSFKSIENKNGKNIKVILVSKAGSEGIDLHNIREVHICDPWWNLNRIEQIIGRSIRNYSHINMDMKYRNVTVYLHSSIAPITNKNITKETIDIYMYRVAMQKQLKIASVENILRASAFDCHLNKDINNRSIKKLNTTLTIETSQRNTVKFQVGDKPYTHMCGYSKQCEYLCDPEFTISDKDINNDTFSEYFINDDIKYIKNKIKQLFHEQSVYTLKELYAHASSDLKIKKMERIYILIAMQKLIDTKETFIGTYERTGYITYNNTYYLFTPISNQEHLSLYDHENPILYKTSEQMIKPSLVMTKKTLKKKNINYSSFEEKIEKNVDKLKNSIHKNKIYLDDAYWSNKTNNIEQILYDIVIDELKNPDKEHLLQSIIKNNKNKQKISPFIYESSKHYLIEYKNELYYKFFNNNQIKYYYLRHENGDFIEPTALFAKKLRDIDNLHAKKKNNKYSSINGYISDANFKLVNNSGKHKTSSGVVCVNMDKPMIINSINEMIGYIKYDNTGISILSDENDDIIKNIKKTKKKRKKNINVLKIHKEGLCLELQLLLRYKEKYDNLKLIWFVRDLDIK
jgi:superfamily II DNA or RNA helicase